MNKIICSNTTTIAVVYQAVWWDVGINTYINIMNASKAYLLSYGWVEAPRVVYQYRKKWGSDKFNVRCMLYYYIANLDNTYRQIRSKWVTAGDLIALITVR